MHILPYYYNNSSIKTSSTSDSLMRVETKQSPSFSMSWMVRLVTPLNSASLGTERPFSIRISFNFMNCTPYFFDGNTKGNDCNNKYCNSGRTDPVKAESNNDCKN